MDALADVLSWRRAAEALVLYGVTLALYRLFLHPLAGFPGPRLAAVSRWYEAYHDVVCDGQYTFKIRELHKQYGPVVRISPHELHVSDPAFFDQLYRHDGRWHKYAWAVDGFAAPGAVLCTANHDAHRARRQPINPVFSRARIHAQQPAVKRHLARLFRRLRAAAASNSSGAGLGEEEEEEDKLSSSSSSWSPTLNLGAAISALVQDITQEYLVGTAYGDLDKPDFNEGVLRTSAAGGRMWHLGKHVTWVVPLLKSIPLEWMVRMAGDDDKVLFEHLMATERDTKAIMQSIADGPTDTGEEEEAEAPRGRTLVHEIMESRLPAADKAPRRVQEDVGIVTGAGFETTASCLRVALANVYHDPRILSRLRAELDAAAAAMPAAKNNNDDVEEMMPLPLELPDLRALEALPYLTAVLSEALRLSPAVATRMARVPERDLYCAAAGRSIPAGAAVGMTLVLLHTDEDAWPDPFRFDPERWMPGAAAAATAGGEGEGGGGGGEKKLSARRVFAPFSKGTRMCVGMNMAYAEMYLTLAAIVRCFDVQLDGSSPEDFLPIKDNFAIGVKSQGFLYAKVRERA